jgi:autotransporter-associated beta strand protein
MKNLNNPFLPSLLVAIAFATTSHAATLFWDGAGTLSTSWTNTASLYAQSDGNDPGAAAGVNDDIVFVYAGLDNTMYLTQTTGTISVRSLTFNNTGISQIRAGNASRTLNIGAGGITVNSGAGAVLLGRANGTTGGVTQTYRLAANQTWTNNDDSTLDFYYGGAGTGGGVFGSAIDTNAKVLTLAGTGNFSLDTPISGTGSLIKGGSGTATIGNAFAATGANTYSGTTTVNEGTLILQGGNAIADTEAATLADATTALIQLNASETIGSLAGGGTTGGTVNLQGNTLTVGDANTSTTFAGILSGTGGLTKQGTGALALSGPNTYEGATIVSAGSLVFQSTAAKPSLSAVSVAAGATLGLGVGTAPDYYTDTEIDALFANTLPGVSMDPASNVGIDTTAGDFTCASNLAAGAKGLTKLGGNTLTLTGTNAYGGPTSINAGSLLISAANHLGDASQATNTIILGAATLRSSANTYDLGINRSINLTGPATIQVDADALTVSGTVSGANSLTKSGAGTLALSGTNSYSGETIISGGTVRVDSASGLGTTSRVRFTSGAAALNRVPGSS